jgi:hypothetical protein
VWSTEVPTAWSPYALLVKCGAAIASTYLCLSTTSCGGIQRRLRLIPEDPMLFDNLTAQE